MSLESNHAAAGTAATTARGEMKQEWYKKPTVLHFIIATGIIVIALVINYSFEFNFFWKLLLGGALVWGGGKITATKIDSVKIWGNILRGLGWVIFVIALLNSGVRTLAERALIKADQTLTEFAATVETAAGTAGVPGNPQRLQLQDGKTIPVDTRKLGPNNPMPVRMYLNDTATVQVDLVRRADGRPLGDGVTAYGICAKVTEPDWIPGHKDTPKKHLEPVNQKVGWFHDMRLTQEMKTFLVKNEVTAVTVSFYLVLTTVGTRPNCQ